MHRLFVAIRPPRVVREQLLAAMGGVSGARWQEDGQLHLTLRFIGEVDRHRAEDIHAALGAIDHPSFEIALDGVQAFEHRGYPVALWTGITPREPLDLLHRKVDQACVRAGIEPDHRAYLPHITLARLGRSAGAIGPFLAASGDLSGAPFAVDHYCLYESELMPAGPLHTLVERYPLRLPPP